MIERTDLDRAMTSYFESRTASQAPDGLLDAALARVETTRQRPAMLVADHWLPTDRSGAARMRKAALAALTVALLIASAVAVGIIVGSQRRLPPPFGLAKPGLIAFDMGGDIFVANPDGTGIRQLTSGPSDGETFSPDGTLIAYQTDAQDMSGTVMVMSPDGDRRVAVAEHLAEIGDIVWSPDSRRVAFAARIMGASGFRVYTAAIDHPGAVQVGGPDVFGREPSWSPDGRELAFKRIEGLDQGPYSVGTLWVIDVDGSNLHRLGDTRASGDNAYWNTSWSPDGKRLAFLAQGVGGKFDVYVINADGTGERDISNTPADEYWPSWSPDGTRVAFPTMDLSGVNQGTAIVVDPDGSHRVEFAGTPINSNTLIWSPDGKRLIGYAKNPDPSQDYNVAIAIFDVAKQAPPTTIPANRFSGASWQRLAP
jgi:Tol biopolymer transport system component